MHGHMVHDDLHTHRHRHRMRRIRRRAGRGRPNVGPAGLGRRAFMRRVRDAGIITADDLARFSERADAALDAGRLDEDEHWMVQHRIERLRERLFRTDNAAAEAAETPEPGPTG